MSRFNLNRPHKQKSDVNLLIQLRISVSITRSLPVESSSSTSSCFYLIIVFKRQVLATPQHLSTLTSAGVRLRRDTFGRRGGTADAFLLHCLLSDSTDGTPTEMPKLRQKSSACLNAKELKQRAPVIVRDTMLTGPEGTQTAAEHGSL